MKTTKLLLGLSVAVASLLTMSAQASIELTLDRALGNSDIKFGTTGINFETATAGADKGANFVLSDSVDFESYRMKITGGPWTVGPVVGNAATIGTGTGAQLWVSDNTGKNYAKLADITWGQINGTKVGGTIGSTIKLSSIAYSGTSADLQQLSAYKSGVLNISYNFGKEVTLDGLLSNGGVSKSFSGTITAVPEASTAVTGFGAAAFMFVVGWNIHRRKQDVIRVK